MFQSSVIGRPVYIHNNLPYSAMKNISFDTRVDTMLLLVLQVTCVLSMSGLCLGCTLVGCHNSHCNNNRNTVIVNVIIIF